MLALFFCVLVLGASSMQATESSLKNDVAECVSIYNRQPSSAESFNIFSKKHGCSYETAVALRTLWFENRSTEDQEFNPWINKCIRFVVHSEIFNLTNSPDYKNIEKNFVNFCKGYTIALNFENPNKMLAVHLLEPYAIFRFEDLSIEEKKSV